MNRRELLRLAPAALATVVLAKAAAYARPGPFAPSLKHQFADIEKKSGSRLGIALLNDAWGVHLSHRGDERFPMCSTFKLIAAGSILARVDAGQEDLERRIAFEARDVVVNSPVTTTRAGGLGMSIRELCAAAIAYSDNTAGNLLLSAIGGPGGLNQFLRRIGDEVTRLDRIEPDLNQARPGDVRDTTTPNAMLANVRTLVLGRVLSNKSRAQLTSWLLGNKTGDQRLRAGLPKTWRVADKTGAGASGTTNDVGILWPPERTPLVVTIYSTGSRAEMAQRNAVIAEVGRAIAASLTGADGT
jgi:beta-lactamase class A